jgi:hypothetical protein
MSITLRTGKEPKIDAILAGEFTCSSPDIVLRLAVLERAIRDIIDFNQSKRCANAATKRDAWNWFESDVYTRDWFSFASVCEDLDLDPNTIRKEIITKIATPDFLHRFENMQGATICGLRRTSRLRNVRYSKKYRLERGQGEKSPSTTSAEGTIDLPVYESSSDAEEKSHSSS